MGPALSPGKYQSIKIIIINKDKNNEMEEGDESRDNKDNEG